MQEPEKAREEAARGKYGPIRIMDAIRDVTGGDVRIVSDVGQHQMWTAQFFKFTKPNSLITSGGLGTMGFALPAAMGVAFAYPDDNVWVVAGDGGFQMNLQELATIRDFGLNINIAILNKRLPRHGPPVAALLPPRPLLTNPDLRPRVPGACRGVRPRGQGRRGG